MYRSRSPRYSPVSDAGASNVSSFGRQRGAVRRSDARGSCRGLRRWRTTAARADARGADERLGRRLVLACLELRRQVRQPALGHDPQTGSAYNEVRGTATDENNFLRSLSNDLYLWYSEIVDRDPSLHTTPEYFNLLKTTAITASGRPKDRFHFTYPTSEWLALQQSGESVGYGAVWSVRSTSAARSPSPITEPRFAGVATGRQLAAWRDCYGRRRRRASRP